MTNLFLGASRTTTPRDITGTIDANGKVDLVLTYERLLKTGSNECTLGLPPDPRTMARVYGVSRMELAAAARRVGKTD